MTIDLSEMQFTIPCPNCRFGNKIRIKDVQLMKTILCCGCHCKINLIDKNNTVKRKIPEMQNALDSLFDKMNTMNFKITLKL